ncbi:hypothetical protein WICMUC_000935 [Wickerhamomyces mucosus]|uniref:Thiol-specific monooxygenase n=1 Tax=Wickerhamomyces mucosus TaxID=1378264 RepID=A0A9P8TI47_9ASCO|nr:hypothetical protein WICMUC_000935 [Wickerhamomyces mucosus]
MTQDHPNSQSGSVPRKVRSVAIIGGGASGAIALDSLKKIDQFDEIVLYERRNVPGGVWYLDNKPNKLDVPPGLTQEYLDPKLKIPEFKEGIAELKLPRSNQERYIHTASYENLKTNIPEQLMTFSDEKTWSAPPELIVEKDYVRGTVIQKYIEKYINRNKSHVVYNTTIESIDKDYSNPEAKFKLTLRTELDETNSSGENLDKWHYREFDAVVIATGHYHVPYIPNVPGLNEVYNRYPHKISHSKTFRATDDFTNQKIIVIGTRASGADIVEIASSSAREVYQSKRTKEAALRWKDADNSILKPIITKYELTSSGEVKVYFEDGSVVENPDQIIYATGFRYSYPFLRGLYPNFTTGYIIPDLYKHTFFIKDPLLSVIGVPTDAISFRAFEFQSVLVSRYLAGLISLPPLEEQLQWTNERFVLKGDTRSYHTIDFDNKLPYLQSLVDLGGGVDPIDPEKKGRPFPTWTEEDLAKHQEILEKLAKFFGRVKEGVTV